MVDLLENQITTSGGRMTGIAASGVRDMNGGIGLVSFFVSQILT
jgi:hypothetical protein